MIPCALGLNVFCQIKNLIKQKVYMTEGFDKFFTSVNEFIHPNFTTPHRKKHHSLLRCVVNAHNEFVFVRHTDIESKTNASNVVVHQSFVDHHWTLIQMAKEYDTQMNDLIFPFRVFVTYVLDETDPVSAQVLSYELHMHKESFRGHMQQIMTFPFEIYVTKLMRQLLSKCSTVHAHIRTIHGISDDEYQFLSDACPKIYHWNENVPLFKHQLESFAWMYDLEKSILKSEHITFDPVTMSILDTKYFYNRTYDVITAINESTSVSVPIRGGIVADSTGSGKTAVAFALIMSTLKDSVHNVLMTPLDEQMYFKSHATLIVTPSNLSQQWIHEMSKFLILKNLKIVFVTNLREFKKTKLSDLLDADFVLTTESFLCSKRYNEEVFRQARNLIKFPFVENELTPSINRIAWRIAVNQNVDGFGNAGCIPMECIKWKRLVFDEIHAYIGHKTFPKLSGCFHWGLTGTPMIQNQHIMEHYVNFISSKPQHWVPNFMTALLDRCFHRFDGLELNPLDRHLYLVEHTEREKQLLNCCQDQLNPEKMIQLCSYFYLVNISDMDQKIQMLGIDDIIRSVKKCKKSKIKDLDSKIRYHDLAIKAISQKIEESKQEMKRHMTHFGDNDLIILDVTPTPNNQPHSPTSPNHLTSPTSPNHSTSPTSPASPDPQYEVHDVRDVRDALRGRKRRLDRMKQRHAQLLVEKARVERSIGYFESKVDDIKNHPLEVCPICMGSQANVITQCGHLFCRVCIIKCLKKKYQCPICKATVNPTDAHEIKLNSATNVNTKENEERVSRYGTKMTRMMALIQSILSRGEKIVIFSQWLPLMTSICEMLTENSVPCVIMSGNAAQQNSAIKKFKTPKTNVLIGSVDTTGLDLSDANHLIFAHSLLGEEYVVKALEDQAIARINRTGQTRQVHVYWFISRGTIEEQTYLQTRGSG